METVHAPVSVFFVDLGDARLKAICPGRERIVWRSASPWRRVACIRCTGAVGNWGEFGVCHLTRYAVHVVQIFVGVKANVSNAASGNVAYQVPLVVLYRGARLMVPANVQRPAQQAPRLVCIVSLPMGRWVCADALGEDKGASGLGDTSPYCVQALAADGCRGREHALDFFRRRGGGQSLRSQGQVGKHLLKFDTRIVGRVESMPFPKLPAPSNPA